MHTTNFVDNVLRIWNELVNSLVSDGGSTVVSILIMCLAFWMYKHSDINELKTVIVFAAGHLVGQNSNGPSGNSRRGIEVSTPPIEKPKE